MFTKSTRKVNGVLDTKPYATRTIGPGYFGQLATGTGWSSGLIYLDAFLDWL